MKVLDGGVAVQQEGGFISPAVVIENLFSLIQPPLKYSQDMYRIESGNLLEPDNYEVASGIDTEGNIYLISNEVHRVTGKVIHKETGITELEFDVSMTWKVRDWRDTYD